ncbi:unnamed protein product [Trichogramma brassicae]|uniref:Uncharacterized protein n=1 Tax=Trichogramma brassicae TaxID=86971 RepID=A0A6H5I2I2_9HYME|nr:unnamed protein product [Trichogramma brassicae]
MKEHRKHQRDRQLRIPASTHEPVGPLINKTALPDAGSDAQAEFRSGTDAAVAPPTINLYIKNCRSFIKIFKNECTRIHTRHASERRVRHYPCTSRMIANCPRSLKLERYCIRWCAGNHYGSLRPINVETPRE